jgi:putative phosphoserine phosphatase / 1-acylglycerol-3-phosphate O-acyltransferase
MERMFTSFLIRRGYLKPGDMMRYLAHLARNWSDFSADLMRSNKKHFRDKDPEDLAELARECFESDIKPAISTLGRQAVADHIRQGHMVVLLTGSLLPLAELLKKELRAHLALAATLAEEHGFLSGDLANTRPYGQEKARLALQTASEYDIDLTNSYAYGDHHTDQDILALVGYPVAVNPTITLRRIAQDQGWPVVSF